MNKTSRRALARWSAEQLVAGKSAKDISSRLAAMLIQSGRVSESEFLFADIAWELEHKQQLTVGRVTSAHALSKELETMLKAQLKKATRVREIVLEKQLNKSVLGGLKVETSSRVWDGTVARKLSELTEAF